MIEPPHTLLVPGGSGNPESEALASGTKAGYWHALPVHPASHVHVATAAALRWQTPFSEQFRSEVQDGGGGGGDGGAGGVPSFPATKPRGLGRTTPPASKRKQAGSYPGATGCHTNRWQCGRAASQAAQQPATVIPGSLMMRSSVAFCSVCAGQPARATGGRVSGWCVVLGVGGLSRRSQGWNDDPRRWRRS